jgi:hypothetical protein
MEIQFTPFKGGMQLEVVYAVAGYLLKGMNNCAGPADMIVAEPFTRLKRFIRNR